jgi:hypothetical protein
MMIRAALRVGEGAPMHGTSVRPSLREFGVRVASMGQVITAIGIIRDMSEGGVGSAQRMSPPPARRID